MHTPSNTWRRSRHITSQVRGRRPFTPSYDTTRRYAAIDWGKTVWTLPRSQVLKRIMSPLIFNMYVALIVVLIQKRTPWSIPVITSLPHQLLGSALGLLLVFRTNAAYDRFWEARKQWGIVTSECRQMAGLACTFMRVQQALPLLSLVAAFPVVMKTYLRGERDTRRLMALVAQEEVDALDRVENQPQFILMRLRSLAQASAIVGVSEKEREMMLKCTGTLGECVSTCERIYNTPIPLSYSRHTSRFLALYTSTLPFVLVSALGWVTVPVIAFLSWALFGILEIGNLIEEPFTACVGSDHRPLMPITEVCRTIRRDVRTIAQHRQLAEDCNLATIETDAVVKKLPDTFQELIKLFNKPSADKKDDKTKPKAVAKKDDKPKATPTVTKEVKNPKEGGVSAAQAPPVNTILAGGVQRLADTRAGIVEPTGNATAANATAPPTAPSREGKSKQKLDPELSQRPKVSLKVATKAEAEPAESQAAEAGSAGKRRAAREAEAEVPALLRDLRK
jgi:putative membrane protein